MSWRGLVVLTLGHGSLAVSRERPGVGHRIPAPAGKHRERDVHPGAPGSIHDVRLP